jgi:hypothetical protein
LVSENLRWLRDRKLSTYQITNLPNQQKTEVFKQGLYGSNQSRGG